MIQIERERFEQIVQVAFDKANRNRRWETAIVRAKQIAESNPYVEMKNGTLIMLSDSNEIYTVTARHCPCKAFRQGQPCKHRALHRLLTRYNEGH